MAIQSVGAEGYLPLQQLIPLQQQMQRLSLPSQTPTGPVNRFGPSVASAFSPSAQSAIAGRDSKGQLPKALSNASQETSPLVADPRTSTPMQGMAPPGDGRGLYLDISA